MNEQKKSPEEWRHHFDDLAANYDNPIVTGDNTPKAFKLRYQTVKDFLLSLNLSRGYSLLDCGCGAGIYLELAESMGANPTGIDFSEKAIERACKKKFNCTTGDVTNIPFNTAAFDVILSIEVLPCIASPEQFFSECARVLKPGGKLLVITLFSGFFRTHILPFFLKPDRYLYHPTRLSEIFSEKGFLVKKSGYLYTFPGWLNLFSHIPNRRRFFNHYCRWIANDIYLVAEKID